MKFQTLFSAQLCFRIGVWRTFVAHWMVIFKAFNFSWTQNSCFWLVGKR